MNKKDDNRLLRRVVSAFRARKSARYLVWREMACAAVIFLVASPGCENHSQPVAPASDEPDQRVSATTSEPSTDTTDRAAETSWHVVCIDGEPVGRRRTSRRNLLRDGEPVVETRSHETITVARDGQTVQMDFECVVNSSADGEFLDANYRLPLPEANSWMQATVKGDELVISAATGDRPDRQLPWSNDFGGPFAVAESLRATPLSPGESSELRYFEPSIGDVVRVTVRAEDWENAELLNDERKLLKVHAIHRMPNGASLESTLWVDGDGEVWKEKQSVGLDIVTYRTTEEPGSAINEPQPVDLFHRTLVHVTGMPALSDLPEEMVYSVLAPKGDADTLFVEDARQQIRALGTDRIKLTVVAPDVKHENSLAGKNAGPTDADIGESDLIQTNDPDIQALAQSVAGDKQSVVETALALETLVYDLVDEKSYGQVFESAADVLRTRKGDCTEHTVLLIALCRARGIPARTAMGLVYSEAHKAFAYHMWAEAWTGDAWRGLDATLGKGGVGPTHLKMAHSSLDDASALSDMMKILQSVQGLQIEVASPNESPK